MGATAAGDSLAIYHSIEQFCAAKCDPLLTFTKPADGKEVDLGFTPTRTCLSSALLLVGAPFWVLHRNYDKSFDDLLHSGYELGSDYAQFRIPSHLVVELLSVSSERDAASNF